MKDKNSSEHPSTEADGFISSYMMLAELLPTSDEIDKLPRPASSGKPMEPYTFSSATENLDNPLDPMNRAVLGTRLKKLGNYIQNVMQPIFESRDDTAATPPYKNFRIVTYIQQEDAPDVKILAPRFYERTPFKQMLAALKPYIDGGKPVGPKSSIPYEYMLTYLLLRWTDLAKYIPDSSSKNQWCGRNYVEQCVQLTGEGKLAAKQFETLYLSKLFGDFDERVAERQRFQCKIESDAFPYKTRFNYLPQEFLNDSRIPYALSCAVTAHDLSLSNASDKATAEDALKKWKEAMQSLASAMDDDDRSVLKWYCGFKLTDRDQNFYQFLLSRVSPFLFIVYICLHPWCNNPFRLHLVNEFWTPLEYIRYTKAFFQSFNANRSDIYISRELTVEFPCNDPTQKPTQKISEQNLWKEVGDRANKLVITAPAGYGKTVFLWHIATNLSYPIPVSAKWLLEFLRKPTKPTPKDWIKSFADEIYDRLYGKFRNVDNKEPVPFLDVKVRHTHIEKFLSAHISNIVLLVDDLSGEGFDAVDRLNSIPFKIIATAHDTHPVDSFKKNVWAYTRLPDFSKKQVAEYCLSVAQETAKMADCKTEEERSKESEKLSDRAKKIAQDINKNRALHRLLHRPQFLHFFFEVNNIAKMDSHTFEAVKSPLFLLRQLTDRVIIKNINDMRGQYTLYSEFDDKPMGLDLFEIKILASYIALLLLRKMTCSQNGDDTITLKDIKTALVRDKALLESFYSPTALKLLTSDDTAPSGISKALTVPAILEKMLAGILLLDVGNASGIISFRSRPLLWYFVAYGFAAGMLLPMEEKMVEPAPAIEKENLICYFTKNIPRWCNRNESTIEDISNIIVMSIISVPLLAQDMALLLCQLIQDSSVQNRKVRVCAISSLIDSLSQRSLLPKITRDIVYKAVFKNFLYKETLYGIHNLLASDLRDDFIEFIDSNFEESVRDLHSDYAWIAGYLLYLDLQEHEQGMEIGLLSKYFPEIDSNITDKTKRINILIDETQKADLWTAKKLIGISAVNALLWLKAYNTVLPAGESFTRSHPDLLSIEPKPNETTEQTGYTPDEKKALIDTMAELFVSVLPSVGSPACPAADIACFGLVHLFQLNSELKNKIWENRYSLLQTDQRRKHYLSAQDYISNHSYTNNGALRLMFTLPLDLYFDSSSTEEGKAFYKRLSQEASFYFGNSDTNDPEILRIAAILLKPCLLAHVWKEDVALEKMKWLLETLERSKNVGLRYDQMSNFMGELKNRLS